MNKLLLLSFFVTTASTITTEAALSSAGRRALRSLNKTAPHAAGALAGHHHMPLSNNSLWHTPIANPIAIFDTPSVVHYSSYAKVINPKIAQYSNKLADAVLKCTHTFPREEKSVMHAIFQVLKEIPAADQKAAIDSATVPFPGIEEGIPILSTAVYSADRATVGLLLGKGASQLITHKIAQAVPLHYAMLAWNHILQQQYDEETMNFLSTKIVDITRLLLLSPLPGLSGITCVNVGDQNGDTPLHFATLNCIGGKNTELVKLLMTAPDANPNTPNKRGKTAIHLVHRALERATCEADHELAHEILNILDGPEANPQADFVTEEVSTERESDLDKILSDIQAKYTGAK